MQLEPDKPFPVPTRLLSLEQKCSGGESVANFGMFLGGGVVGVDVFGKMNLAFL